MQLMPSMSSNLEAENGVVRFCPPIPATKLVEWVDPEHDMGIFAARKFCRQLRWLYCNCFALLKLILLQ
jgi:hypothetical protein